MGKATDVFGKWMDLRNAKVMSIRFLNSGAILHGTFKVDSANERIHSANACHLLCKSGFLSDYLLIYQLIVRFG